MMDRKTAWNM